MLMLADEIRQKTGMSYRAICSAVKLPYANLIRWRTRSKEDLPILQQPGPAKVALPDWGILHLDISRLSHGIRRTAGTTALYGRHGISVSRRELHRLVELARHEHNELQRQNLRRIQWNVPNVAWSLDPCEYEQRDETGNKKHLSHMQDLASRYKFDPMTGEEPCGEEIAGYLAATFKRFGPPLFLKRDNGGNVNHTAVNDVLSEHFVIPLNSPAHYPPYNGAIEQAQAELKTGLAAKLAHRACCPREHLEVYAATVAHDLNHRLRPCLEGKTACQVYFTGRRTFTKWERRDAYGWITELRDDIVSTEGVQPQTAWRVAAEAWLNMKGFITITINGKVLPTSFPILDS